MNIVFITGTGRCGSTLVHEILSRHPDLGFVSNIEDNLPRINRLGRWNNAIYRTPLGAFTRKGGLRFAPSEAYNIISREVSPIYANSSRDLLAEDVTPWLEKGFKRFFESRNRAQGKPIFSHKYTGWPRIGFFHQIFQNAKFIHIIRDGRAVTNSWLQMPWWDGYRGPENWLWGELSSNYRDEWERANRSFITLAAISWKILMDAFARAVEALPKKYCLCLRFEDLLKDPREHFCKILEFVGTSWNETFERSFAKQVFHKDRQQAFRSDLAPEQVKQLEESLGEHLVCYGYE